MRFEKTQVIDGTVDEVERALLSDDYLQFVLKHHGVLNRFVAEVLRAK